MTGLDRLHEIAEDVGRTVWLRELGAALRDTADAIEGGTRDLSGYESDVLAWVEKNGGLEAVKERTMPEDIEWLVEVWPRFEDGEPVRVGDEVVDEAEELVYRVSEIAFSDGYGTCLRYEDQRDGNSYNFIDGLEPGERVKRPAPKVLDADGVEIRVGDVLYRKSDGCMVKVAEVYEKTFIDAAGCVRPGDGFTHRAPVLAADGKPLREARIEHMARLTLRGATCAALRESFPIATEHEIAAARKRAKRREAR